MDFRFRKSKKIMPGVRLNFSKKGMGVSFGGKHARYSISPTGRRTTSFKVAPGLTYSTSSGGRKRKNGTKNYHSKYTLQPESVPTKPTKKKQTSSLNLPITLIIAGVIFGLSFLSAKLIGGVVVSVIVIIFGIYLLPIKWHLPFAKDKPIPQAIKTENGWICPECKTENSNSVTNCKGCGRYK